MRKKRNHFNKRGFTLAEVMIVVAIIIILGALAAPNVIKYQNDLRELELTETAREIALSVQNKLINMKSAGMLKESELGSEITQESAEVYSFDSDNYSGPLKVQTLNVIEGKFIVTFNIRTGDVTKVEYTKNGYTGYYVNEITTNGESISQDFASKDDTIHPVLSVVNDNQVMLTVYIPESDNIDVGAGLGGFSYDLKMSYGDGLEKPIDASAFTTSLCSTQVDASQNYKYKSTSLDITSLVENLVDSSGNPYIGNVSISVDVAYQGISKKYLTDSASTQNFTVVHNLFGSGTLGNTIDVSCRRHIDNLSETDKLQYFSYDTSKRIEVIQSADIDLSKTYNGKTKYFSPIKNVAFFGDATNSKDTVFNGNKYEILNLTVKYDDPNVTKGGLFAYSNCNLTNIYLNNPYVDVRSQYGTAGALVGTVYGGNITYCRAYLTDVKETGDYRASSSTKDDEGKLRADIFGAYYSGGLIGESQGGKFVGNLAALNVGSDFRSGGFVGYAPVGSFKCNYASGMVHLTNSNTNQAAYAGGFVGAAGSNDTTKQSSFSYCSSFGDVHVSLVEEAKDPTKQVQPTAFAGGFAGALGTNVSVDNLIAYGCSRTYCYDSENKIKTDGGKPINCGGFAAPGFTVDKTKKCVYAFQGYYYSDGAVGVEPSELVRSNSERSSVVIAYSSNCKNDEFPFRFIVINNNVVLPHYGDWPLIT